MTIYIFEQNIYDIWLINNKDVGWEWILSNFFTHLSYFLLITMFITILRNLKGKVLMIVFWNVLFTHNIWDTIETSCMYLSLTFPFYIVC